MDNLNLQIAKFFKENVLIKVDASISCNFLWRIHLCYCFAHKIKKYKNKKIGDQCLISCIQYFQKRNTLNAKSAKYWFEFIKCRFLSFLYFIFRQYHDILSINITLKDKITAVDELLPSELKEGFGRVWNA